MPPCTDRSDSQPHRGAARVARNVYLWNIGTRTGTGVDHVEGDAERPSAGNYRIAIGERGIAKAVSEREQRCHPLPVVPPIADIGPLDIVDRKDDLLAIGDFSHASGRSAAEYLLALDDRVTAVLVSNDQMTLGTLLVAEERGLREPVDLSIVSFDDTPVDPVVIPAEMVFRGTTGPVPKPS